MRKPTTPDIGSVVCFSLTNEAVARIISSTRTATRRTYVSRRRRSRHDHVGTLEPNSPRKARFSTSADSR